jgi:hypothetical protein
MTDLEYPGEYSRRYYPKSGIETFGNYFNVMSGKPRYLAIFRQQ